MPRASQEQIARVHLGALAQAVLLDRREYFDVLRDHAAATAWDPAGTELVSQYQDPERVFVQHNQEGLGPPVVSLPVQGTVAADSVAAARQLTALVGGATTTTITLRLAWSALGSRLLSEWIPRRCPLNGTRCSRFAWDSPRRRQTARTGIRISPWRFRAVRAPPPFQRVPSTGCCIPDPPPFGPAKIVMQTLRLPVARLVERGVDPSDLRSIALVFDRRQTGVVYVGDLQFTN